MKGAIILLALASGARMWATTYYVSSSTGNDANAGTSTSVPWKTIAHVNGQTFQPGDSILFKRGDVWNESLAPGSSGSLGNPIKFDAYGSGAAPNLNGILCGAIDGVGTGDGKCVEGGGAGDLYGD